jgi:hypothetical protein
MADKFCINCKFLSNRWNVSGLPFCEKWAVIDLVTGKDTYAIAREERATTGRCKEAALAYEPKQPKIPPPPTADKPEHIDSGGAILAEKEKKK